MLRKLLQVTASSFVTKVHALQKDIYRAAGKPLVDALFDGFDCALLAYGQTGAGKT
jgi:hypothetical protein